MALLSRKFKHFVLMCGLLVAGQGFAADTPDKLEGATIVDADKAKELQGAGASVFDVRVANEYVDGHIKGAVSLPYQEKSKKEVGFDVNLDKFDLSKLGSDKSKSIVFYCNGPECWKSYKASSAAIKAGFKSVYWFRTGFPAWQEKKYPVDK